MSTLPLYGAAPLLCRPNECPGPPRGAARRSSLLVAPASARRCRRDCGPGRRASSPLEDRAEDDHVLVKRPVRALGADDPERDLLEVAIYAVVGISARRKNRRVSASSSKMTLT